MDECCKILATVPDRQRRVFQVVLVINIVMFLVESIAGIVSSSTALLADSADMLGDAIIYGFSLYVIGKGNLWQARAAILKGLLMGTFGLGVFIHVVYKILYGVVPSFEVVGVVGLLALTANVLCLILLWPRRSDDINMRSAWICSRNDVIGNVGVLVSALGVYLTDSPWPDLLIGLVIVSVFSKSAISVIRDASREYQFANL